MLTLELKLYEEPSYSYKSPSNGYTHGYVEYYKKFSKKEINKAIADMNAAGIKVGQKYAYATNTGYFITIMGVDQYPSSSTYSLEPMVVLAKGSAAQSLEVGYSVSEINKMQLIQE